MTILGNLWDFGQLFKPLATVNLSKSLTLLGNFCEDVKIYHFSSEIILSNFFLVTLVPTILPLLRVKLVLTKAVSG